MDPVMVLLAFIAASGVFIAFMGVTALTPRVALQPGEKVGLMEKLEKRLHQVGWDVTPQEFIQMVAGFSLMGGLITLIAARSIPLAIMGALLGGLSVVERLESKREEARIRFQNALPELASLFYDAIASGRDVPSAFARIAGVAPEAVKADFEEAARMLQTGVRLEDVVRKLGARRDDPDFWALLDTLLVFQEEGGQLLTVIASLEETMRERNNIRSRVRAEQQGMRNTAILLAVMPFIMILLGFMVMRPVIASFYNSPWGLPYLLLVVGGLSFMGYYLTEKMAIAPLRVLEMQFRTYKPEEVIT